MTPAREVGGDFYDFFLIDKDRLGFVIGDVSGKGVPAAIFMAVCRTLLKATALQNISAGRMPEIRQRCAGSPERFGDVRDDILRNPAPEYGRSGVLHRGPQSRLSADAVG